MTRTPTSPPRGSTRTVRAVLVAAALLGPAAALPAQVFQPKVDPEPINTTRSTRDRAADPAPDRGTADRVATRSAPAGEDPLAGFDFGQVIERYDESMDPLQAEMTESFRVFDDSLDRAEALLAEGRTQEAIEEAVAAIDGVSSSKDRVLSPMWEGQRFLSEQTATVRQRLAESLMVEGAEPDAKLDKQTESMLDGIAMELLHETDPARRQRLVMRYRAVRNLAQIKRLTEQLSPDQRRLWVQVHRVLEEASNTHLEVMLGTESLFAQFDATAENLRSYLGALEMLDDAGELLGRVRGDGDEDTGLAAFAANLNRMRESLAGFNTAVEGMISTSMTDLESRVAALRDDSLIDGVESGGDLARDAEFQARLERLQGTSDTTASTSPSAGQ